MQGAWRSSTVTLLLLHLCRLCEAAGSGLFFTWPHSRAHCTLLSSTACCHRTSLCPWQQQGYGGSSDPGTFTHHQRENPAPSAKQIPCLSGRIFLSLQRQLLALCFCQVHQEPSIYEQNVVHLLSSYGKHLNAPKKALIFTWKINK